MTVSVSVAVSVTVMNCVTVATALTLTLVVRSLAGSESVAVGALVWVGFVVLVSSSIGITTNVSFFEVVVVGDAEGEDDELVVTGGGLRILDRSGKTTVGTGSKPEGRLLVGEDAVVDGEVEVAVVEGVVGSVVRLSADVVEIVVETDVDVVAVVEGVSDGGANSGSMVKVTVTVPEETVTVAVLVNRGRELAEAEVVAPSEEEPGLGAEVAVTASVEDAVGIRASGIVPRIFLASAMSLQPNITPSVVLIGIAKQALPAGQGIRSKPWPLAHVPMLPAIQAAWPSLQADCLVRLAKMSLYSRASARLLSYTVGGTVLVPGGGVSMTVGMLELGEPVMVGRGEDETSRVPVEEAPDVEDLVDRVEVFTPALVEGDDVVGPDDMPEEGEAEPGLVGLVDCVLDSRLVPVVVAPSAVELSSVAVAVAEVVVMVVVVVNSKEVLGSLLLSAEEALLWPPVGKLVEPWMLVNDVVVELRGNCLGKAGAGGLARPLRGPASAAAMIDRACKIRAAARISSVAWWW